jgi:3-oxoacyl-[acyl-carrier-protein] synthase II
MSDRRVVVTGLGAVSSIGIGADAFTAGLRAGATGTGPITGFDSTGFPAVMAGEVAAFDPDRLLRTIDPGHWGRSAQFAAAAGRLAVEDAGIDAEILREAGTGAIMGTTTGEAVAAQELVRQWVKDGPRYLDPALVAQASADRIATAVASELGLTGDTQTVPTACSASNFALGYASDLVRTGEADFMIAGGADSVNRLTHAGFYRLGALSEDLCRPFDADRGGIITGEGGAALLLEPLDHAVARGARIYAEVLGYGMNCDAAHMVHPDVGGIAECIRLAHRSAGVTPEEIDYICAHGTGTPTNDATEVAAIRAVFGDRVPPVSSVKSMIGHTMGAASGFGAIACCRALYDGFLPPTANLRTTDPALGPDLDCVPGQGRPASPQVVQNHGFAFGGNNVITILGRVA